MKLDFLRPDFLKVICWYVLANLFLVVNDVVYWCHMKKVEAECSQLSLVRNFFKFIISILSPFTLVSRLFLQAKMGDWPGLATSGFILGFTYLLVCVVMRLKLKKKRRKHVAPKSRR